MLKPAFLFLILLLNVSCQKERKTCDFQGVEVSCGALEEQRSLLQAQQQAEARANAEAEAASQAEIKPQTTNASKPQPTQVKPTTKPKPQAKPKPKPRRKPGVKPVKKPRVKPKPKPKPRTGIQAMTGNEFMLPTASNTVKLDVQVKRDQFKFEILENRDEKVILNSIVGEYECDLSVGNGDVITFSPDTDLMEINTSEKKLIFLRKEGISGVARGTWIRKMKFKQGKYEILLSVKDDHKIQITKSCLLH